MGMVVRTNMAGLNANNALNMASKTQQNAMQKLASGFRINKAADDASGLAISEKMKNQIKALDTAADNCEDGANMIQTAEGYMNETHDILNRMTELAEKAANGVLDDTDRDALQDEMDQLCGEIDRMATTANFNGKKLMDGSLGSKAKVKVTSDSVNGFQYESPAVAASRANDLGGGKVSFNALATGTYENDNIKDGMTFSVDAAATATNNLAESTLEVVSKNEDGTLSTTALEVTIKAQKGDTVTIKADGSGTSTNGLVFSGATTNAGATFTFDGENWKTNDGVVMDNTKAKMAAGSRAGDTFEYDASAAKAQVDGTDKNGINLQIGESSTSADRLTVSINSFHTDSLFGGLDGLTNKSNDGDNDLATASVKINNSNSASTYKNAVSINIKDQDNASAAADAIRQISNYVSDERGKLGAQQNRLDHTVNNLTTASENVTASNSRIRDTNMAEEMMNYTSKNVVAQAAQAMLAQANSQPQNVLSLLQ